MFRSKIFLGSLVAATSLSAFLLTSTTVSAENVTRSARIQVASACTMDGAVTNPHNASVTPGTYTDNIGTTVFSVVCNDAAGFGVYAIGYTDNFDGNAVMQGDGNNTIATGTATSGNTSNWAMKLATVDGTVAPTITNGYDDYSIVPSADYVKVASYPSATSASSSAVFKSSYAAYVTLTQPSGTYTGQVKYVLVHPANGPAPQKPCLDFECAYNPNVNKVLSNDPNDQNTYYPMQEIAAICDRVITPAVGSSNVPSAQVVDTRDHKKYWIAKLEDGHCWMTQNLDHDIVTDGSVAYNSTTTDLPAGVTWVPERATYPSNVTHWNDYDEDTNPDGVNGYVHPESYDPGDLYWSGIVEDDSPASTGDPHYHLGNYYNTSAALATNDRNTLANDYDMTQTWVSVEQSICPAGWKLPKGIGGDEDFVNPPDGSIYKLATFYGWDGETSGSVEDPYIWELPIRLPLTGIIYDYPTNISEFGMEGFFHDSLLVTYNGRFSEEYALDMHNNGGMWPMNYGYLYFGRPIRCVVR